MCIYLVYVSPFAQLNLWREREIEREREPELGVARACHMCGNSDLRQLERLVEVFEKSLVKLRKVESWGLWIFGVRVGIGLHET